MEAHSFFAYSGLINAITSIFLGFFVLKSNFKSIVSRLFALFCFSVAYWAFFYFFWLIASTHDRALFFIRHTMVGAILIPMAFTAFVIKFLEKKNRIINIVNILCAFFFLSVSFSPKFIVNVEPRLFFDFWPIPGPFFHFMLAYFLINAVFAHVLLWMAMRSDLKGVRQDQVRSVFIGTVIGFMGGSTNYLLWYGIGIPPILNIFVSVYIIAVAYGIVRFGLLDIQVIIKKTLVFTGLFAMIMAVVTGVTTLTQDIVGRYFAVPQTLSTLLSVALAIALYDPSRKFLINVTDRFLFQKKEDIKVILNKLSRNVITILDIEKLAQTILVALQTTMRVESGAIIIKDENDNDYTLLDAFGIEDRDLTYDNEEFFIHFCTENDRVVNLEDPNQKSSLPVELLNKFEKLKASVVMPLLIHGDLIGVLILGKKRSDQEYTNEEMDYFPTIMSQIAVALSNARLYEILKKSQINFAQQAKMAAIGTLSAGISHEIKNPLNHIKVGIAMLRMNKKHGLFDKMERYKLEEEIFKTLDILDENVGRANEVIERLSSFAKKPKEQKIEAVDLKVATESALSFLKNELDHNSIDVEKNFPEKFPGINADLHTMEDIILNLVVNARHAIGHHGKIKLQGVVEHSHLDFMVSDTGQGIAKENLERIFDPFYTTKDVSRNPDKDAVKGSGLGLFIVREFIQRFGGQIRVESEIGKGTEFHLVFPKEVWA